MQCHYEDTEWEHLAIEIGYDTAYIGEELVSVRIESWEGCLLLGTDSLTFVKRILIKDHPCLPIDHKTNTVQNIRDHQLECQVIEEHLNWLASDKERKLPFQTLNTL